MDISRVKYNLGKPVKLTIPRHYIDSVYMLTGCIIRRDEKTGEFFYQAELRDMNSMVESLMIVRLEDIEESSDDNE